MKQIQISFLCSSIRTIKPIVDFLSKKGIKVSAFVDVKSAVDDWTLSRPDYVLISWNIKTASPKKLADLATKTLRLNCIGFSEESDPRTAASLAGSSLEDIIHAPVSGPVIFMKLQRILKAAETTQPPQEQLESTKVSQKKDGLSWEPALAEKKSIVESQSEQLQKILSSMFTKLTPKKEIKPFKTQECVAIEISDSQLFGYIVVSSRRSDKKTMDQIGTFKTKLQDSLLLYGRGLQITGAYSVNLQVDNFPDWAEDSGRFLCDGKSGNESLCAFFLNKIVDKPKREYTNQFLNVPRDCLIEDEKLSFDVFMHLPINDRTLKIFKKNFEAEGRRLKKLKDQNINLLYIKKVDEAELDKYLADAQLHRSLRLYNTKVLADEGREVV